MAIIRNIYLPDEINDSLKLEENASGLIVELLKKHYNIKEEKEKSIEEREKEIEQARTDFLLRYEADKEKFKEQYKYKRANELTEEEKKQRASNLKLERTRDIQNFVKYLINREFTDMELHEYLIGLEKGLYMNIASYLEEKGINYNTIK
jgi:hypothetical protein